MATEAAVRKGGRGRRPLKDLSANDINISAGKTGPSPLPAFAKENLGGLSVVLSPIKNKKVILKKPGISTAERSLADELQETRKRLEQLSLEKEKTEETLRQRDEVLKQKEEELENRGKDQERLQQELKKLRKLKEFNPTMSFPLAKSLREKAKKKKSKDCPERKRPCPPYMLWCKDRWNEVKKENPDADFKEISTILGARWKKASAEEKKPYEERYQQDKEAYLVVVGQEKRENEAMKLLEEEQMHKSAMELLEQYIQFKQEADKKEGKKKKEKKDPMKPKKPLSAFFVFSKERRTALLKEKKNVIEIARIAGEEWKNMTVEKKAPYEETARKEKEEYDREMELYKQKQLAESDDLEKEEEEQKKVLKQEALQMLKKKEKADNIIKKTKENRRKQKKQKEGHNPDMNKPKKPASSFLLFNKEIRKQLLQERPEISNSTLTALVSVKWKEQSQADKQIWDNRAAEGKARYKLEMEDYSKVIAEGSNVN